MSLSNELYQQVILDHNKNPRNYRAVEEPTQLCHGHNPLCGDHLTVYLKEKEGRVEDVSFQGDGCAISKASASLMTTQVKGKTRAEAETLFREFHAMVTSDPQSEIDAPHLGKLKVFQGVREYPSRIKCASLAWHALTGALQKQEEASTEV
jgi:nitrogen fixation NifU-like protein